jgi:hypothetical protein
MQLFKQRSLSSLCKVTAFPEFLAEWRHDIVTFSFNYRTRTAIVVDRFQGKPGSFVSWPESHLTESHTPDSLHSLIFKKDIPSHTRHTTL